MTKKREASENPPPPPNDLDDDALEILLKEYDALRDLYSRAEASAQSMFNFYLTLLSSIVGGTVLIFQFDNDTRSTSYILSGLLFFATNIGAVYLSAVSARYGHMARFARAIDALRLVLLERTKRLLPPLYAPFLARSESSFRADQRIRPRIGWLLPSGSFQLFIALINSVALAGSAWFLLLALGVPAMQPLRTFITLAVIAGCAFNVFNVYSHLVQQTIIQRLNVDLYTHDQLTFLAGKE